MEHAWARISALLSVAVLLTACGVGGTEEATPTQPAAGSAATTGASNGRGTAAAPEDCGPEAFAGETIGVEFQLQSVPQGQFAGYFAARDLGLYEDAGLDVAILEGATDILPEQVVGAPEGPEFGQAWVSPVLAAREEGADLVNIAQVFQRSGTVALSWEETGLESPEDWEGKRVGVRGGGNELEVYAAADEAGLEPAVDFEVIDTDLGMEPLLARDVDVSQALVYDQLAQVLGTEDPETEELYRLDDLRITDFNELGTSMLQDHIISRESWLARETNGIPHEQIATCFLQASFRGWMHCRDYPEECVDIVLNQGTIFGESHQRWQINEVNALIWPSPDGIGILDEDLWQQTVDIALDFDVIGEDPHESSYRTDLADTALEGIEGDATGTDFEKAVVELRPRGE